MGHSRLEGPPRRLENWMTRSDASADHPGPHHRHNAALEMLNALSMTVGRGSAARAVADLAELTATPHVRASQSGRIRDLTARLFAPRH